MKKPARLAGSTPDEKWLNVLKKHKPIVNKDKIKNINHDLQP